MPILLNQNSDERPKNNLNTKFPKPSLFEKGNLDRFLHVELGVTWTFIFYSGGPHRDFQCEQQSQRTAVPTGGPGQGRSSRAGGHWGVTGDVTPVLTANPTSPAPPRLFSHPGTSDLPPSSGDLSEPSSKGWGEGEESRVHSVSTVHSARQQ